MMVAFTPSKLPVAELPPAGWPWPARRSLQVGEQLRHPGQRHHVGAVARRPVRVLVRLDEDGGHADRDGRPRQHRDELALAAAGAALPARLLHRVGGVEHDRPAGGGHDGAGARMSETSVL